MQAKLTTAMSTEQTYPKRARPIMTFSFPRACMCMCVSVGWSAAPGLWCLSAEATLWRSMTTNQDRLPRPSQRSGQRYYTILHKPWFTLVLIDGQFQPLSILTNTLPTFFLHVITSSCQTDDRLSSSLKSFSQVRELLMLWACKALYIETACITVGCIFFCFSVLKTF